MKIQNIVLRHFKKFRDITLDFTDPETGLAQDLVVLTGMNGAGKTTILQAIAATLGVATRRIEQFTDLAWPGFNYELLAHNWGRFDPYVKLTAQFTVSEVNAVREYIQKLDETGQKLHPPANRNIVKLEWQRGNLRADNAKELFLFRGREYAKQLVKSEGHQVFEQVGTALWYTEQRTSTSLTPEDPERQLLVTEDILRDRLSKWRLFHQEVQNGKITHLRPGQKDLYAEIEQIYKAVFPGRSFEGPVLRSGVDDILSEPWFYLYDGKNQYEISEMSGGERSIFPLLMDFANWNINNSVILIDEVELHLHPPMQQTLIRALPKLGNNNQFIITTHSDYVTQIVPNAHIIRVEV